MFEIRVSQRRTDESDRRFALGTARRDSVDAVLARAGPEPFVTGGKALFSAPRARRQQDILFEVDLRRVDLDRVVRVDPRKMVSPHLHRAAAVGLVRRDEKANVKFALARKLERQVDPVLHLLVGRRFQHRHVDVLAEKARVGGHLGRVAPGIVPHDHDDAAVGMRSSQVAQRKRVGGHMQADAFHHAHRAQPVHLRAVDHRGGERLVVGQDGADAVLLGDLLDRLDTIEKTGHWRTGIARPEMSPTLGFEQPFDQQLVTQKNFRALFLEKPWIDLQVTSLVAFPRNPPLPPSA